MRRKTTAVILRKNGEGRYQLLVHQFKEIDYPYFRMPGGGVDEGETPEEGVLREVEEEAGIKPDSLTLLRKLGVHHYYKPYIHAEVERHDFLFAAPEGLPDTWEHVVAGDGKDAGETFAYAWINGDAVEKIDEELKTFITPQDIPELFE